MTASVLTYFLLLILNFSMAQAGEDTPVDESFAQFVGPVLQEYCYGCHNDQRKRGDLSLETYQDWQSVRSARELWAEVLRRIETGEMPPDGKPQPHPSEKDAVLKAIAAELFPVDCDNPDPGRVTIRRLNRSEYNNTIRDLFGIDFHPADDFPADDTGYGFDNIGDVLSVSPLLVERYLAAAESILDRAIWDPSKRQLPSVSFAGDRLLLSSGGRSSDAHASLHSKGEVFVTHTIERAGEYLLQVRAFAQQAGPEPAKMALQVDGVVLTNVEVKAVAPATEVLQYAVPLSAGEHRFAAAFLNDYYNPEATDPGARDRNLFVVNIELSGRLDSPVARPKSHSRIFACGTEHSHTPECAETIITDFAKRAFRRPVTAPEIERLVNLASVVRESGGSFEESIRIALQGVLVSPHFLFRGELQTEPDNPKARRPITEHDLAARISYFLWTSMPDDELFALADKGELRKNLKPEVERMLKDKKAQALVDNFAGQWLQTRNLHLVAPDAEVFPAFDQALRKAMEQETALFFAHVMSADRSVLDFLVGDYTFVNARLAQHYGLPNVEGDDFQRVSLQGTGRAGVLTHGSVLTVTSNPNRTSPVKRGKWVLENLLAQAPPPPPPDIPPLEESHEASAASSLRERMERHRSDPTCASCHAQMDPIGFSLEHFDGIGAWRTKDGAFEVDASGQLPSGERFNGASELSRTLAMERRDKFVRCLAEKMLIYALGRGLEYYDRCAVDKISEQMAQEDYRFTSLIMAVIESVPFQMRRGEGDPH